MGRKALNKNRKNNREKISEWAEVLFPIFQKNGLKGLTMDGVARYLNKSKTTVYDYFQTKEELLQHLIAYKLDQIRGYEKILEDSKLNYAEKCSQLLEYLSIHISDISTLFLSDLQEQFPELWVKVDEFLEYAAIHLESFYAEGMRENEFNPIHTKVLVALDQVFFRMLCNPEFLSKNGLSLREAFDQFLHLKYYGLIKKQE